jgi:hypothetical protein
VGILRTGLPGTLLSEVFIDMEREPCGIGLEMKSTCVFKI